MTDSAPTTGRLVKTVLWTEGLEEYEGQEVDVEIELTEPDEIALHTMINDEGSRASLYWSRSRAIEVARQLLNAAAS